MKINLISTELTEDNESITIAVRLWKNQSSRIKCIVEIFGSGEIIVRRADADEDKPYKIKIGKDGQARIVKDCF